MKIKKEYAILFFIIAVLVFYIIREKGQKTHYTLPVIPEIDTNEISELVIRKKDAGITLIKENDTWRVGTSRYPADPVQVDEMMKHLRDLTLSALVSESKSYAMYELDSDRRIDVEAYKGEEVIRKVTIGKPASSYRHTFVLYDDDDRVYHAEGNFTTVFKKSVRELRDKTVMKFNEEIREIILKKEKEEIRIVRKSSPVSVDITEKDTQKKEEQIAEEPVVKWVTADDARPVKEKEIDEMITTVSRLQCDEFIEDKQKEDFISPLFTITLKGAKTYSLSIYEKRQEKYPTISSESDYPFLISEWKANRIMKDVDSLIDIQ